MPPWYEFIGLAVLLIFSAFFSASETAFVSVKRHRIKKLAAQDKRAERILKLFENPNRVIASILVGNNIVNISASAIAAGVAIAYLGSYGIGIATGIVTFYILLFGEIVPKSYAAYNPEKFLLKFGRVLVFFVKLLSPLVVIFTVISKRIVKSFGGEVTFGKEVTQEDLVAMVEAGEEEGIIEKEEKEIIASVFEFGETTVREIMVPRVDMKCISIDASLDEARELIVKTGHSRIPVYEGNIDNIVGILHAKDLLRYNNGEVTLREIIREPLFIPENKKLDDLLREFREKKIQIAIVVDEYGGTAGMVTIEDILEELVGEIMDEFDVEEAPLLKLDETQAIVDARMTIKDVNEALEINLPEEEVDTVGGLVFNMLGRVPKVGDKVELEDALLQVEKMRGRRILKVRIIKKEKVLKEE